MARLGGARLHGQGDMLEVQDGRVVRRQLQPRLQEGARRRARARARRLRARPARQGSGMSVSMHADAGRQARPLHHEQRKRSRPPPQQHSTTVTGGAAQPTPLFSLCPTRPATPTLTTLTFNTDKQGSSNPNPAHPHRSPRLRRGGQHDRARGSGQLVVHLQASQRQARRQAAAAAAAHLHAQALQQHVRNLRRAAPAPASTPGRSPL